MEALAELQTNFGKEIEKLTYEYQRESPDRKTVPYLRAKLEVLEKIWTNFETIDDKIRNVHSEEISHPYFINDYYNTVKKGYEDFKTELVRLINHAGSSKGAIKKGQPQGKPQELLSKEKKIPNVNSEVSETTDLITRLLRRQRGVMITLENVIAGTTITSEQSKQYYEVKVDAIKHYWDEVEDINKSIWENVDNVSSCGYKPEDYFALQNKVQEILIQINQELENRAQHNSTVSNGTATNHAFMKLPKVVLPKFDGDYLKWQQFFDLFTQMVHNQPLGNSQKMWYLKMNLSGEAEKLIRHLPLTEDNYAIAWNILNNRYQNKRLLVTALLDKLIAQPTITTESAAALKVLHDNTKECLLSLQNLGLAVRDHWDPIIMHILIKKLDKNTHALYEQSLTSPRDLQSVEKLLNFLEMRFQALETFGQKTNSSRATRDSNKSSVFITNKTNKLECLICNKNHALYFCDVFLKLSPMERQIKAKEFNLCLNCLKKGHNVNKCQSRGCQKCNKKHNTLLHFQSSNQENVNHKNKPLSNQATIATNLAAQSKDVNNGYVFLATALADVNDTDGKPVSCRLLLDSGSQLNFVTEKLRKKLRLADNTVNLKIAGIGDSRLKINNRLHITLSSKLNNYTTNLEVFVIKDISAHQPQRFINTDNWDIPSNIKLADPEFNKPQRIDILLGAEMYGELMRNGQLRLGENLPMLQNTTLGWIVLGKVSSVDYKTPFCGITNIIMRFRVKSYVFTADITKMYRQILTYSGSQ